MRYIIKNCPNYNECGCRCTTNCLLKQIVFFCKMDVGSKDNMLLISRYALADTILDLLEIEECE